LTDKLFRAKVTRMVTRWLLGLVLAVAGLSGCAGSGADFGPATWALDPAFPSPGADTSELHILVWERACSGGSRADGRMSNPLVEYTSADVTITFRVRPLVVGPGQMMSCPGSPGTPAGIRLSEPLGQRTLLDGGVVPPAPPLPPGG
jgi:hypothetical protein